ncbi:MAG: 23S rRNA (guanosine(2251)-2'-O)-methyltransferase RlmB [Elusimicrobia bacterium]|nr:23S rRNA (guanosine(2251)-2'-O)-methyltransferase RlmB [Elusimicrobiota bacterium]
MFPICGKKSVMEALSSKRRYFFKRLLVSCRADNEDMAKMLMLAKNKSIPIFNQNPADLDRWVSGSSNHQGVVLLLNEPPREIVFEELVKKTASCQKAVLAALDCVSDHQNIGAIVRSAVSFGVSGIFAPRDRTAPLIHPAVWRVSQGAVEHIELATVVNLARALETLKDNGFWIVGATSQGNGRDLRKTESWPEKICLVLGNEDKGMRKLSAQNCDMLVSIPQMRPGNLDSLNLASAASVLLWEIFRKKINY